MWKANRRRRRRALEGIKHYADWDSGYSKQQSTRPQTLGYGLTDSPSGQAAWILEKFWAWTDCDGHPENILGRDELLDNVMLYWVTATAASSARLYWESFGPKRRVPFKVTTSSTRSGGVAMEALLPAAIRKIVFSSDLLLNWNVSWNPLAAPSDERTSTLLSASMTTRGAGAGITGPIISVI